MTIKLSIAFRVFGIYFNLGNFDHGASGIRKFSHCTVETKRLANILSYQRTIQTLEQKKAEQLMLESFEE